MFQVAPEKREIDGITVDPPEEIFANKLCALLSRSEVRDLVDVMILERSGLDLEQTLSAAAKKDGGMSPGQLAWVLHEIKFGDDFEPPGGFPLSELRTYLQNLIERLQRFALPS